MSCTHEMKQGAVVTVVTNPRGPGDCLFCERDRLEHERDTYRAMVCDFVACMVPHPTMHATWTKGKAMLKDGPPPLPPPEES